MYKMYGIPNCDSVKKAKLWFEGKNIDFEFRDIRKEPLTDAEWKKLIQQDSENLLLNTKSPSFRSLGVSSQEAQKPEVKLEVLVKSPTSMKRPLIVGQGKIKSVGYNSDRFEEIYT